MSDKLPTKNGLKHGDALLSVFLNFALDYATQKAQNKPRGFEIEWDISASNLC